MNFNIKSFFDLNKVIKNTFFRFPFVYFFIILAVFFSIITIHKVYFFDEETSLIWILISILSIVALTSVKLFIESLGKSIFINILLSTVMVLLISYAVLNFNTSHIFLILSILFSITFSPLLFKLTSKKEFINFNFEIFYSIIFSLIVCSILYLGLSSIYASIGYLFDFKISSKFYFDTCILVYIGLFPILILSKIRKDLNFNIEDTTFNKAIVFLVNNIFVPLLYIYLVILYLYFIKIIWQQEFPKGNLSWMILIFISIGIFIFVVSEKIKNNINTMVENFRKYFYFSILIPLCVLYLAIYIRINTYGITEARYAVILLAIWFTLITCFSIIKKDFDFKWIPILLTGLFLFAALSPFNASVVSAKSQLNRFFTILEDNKLFVDKKIIPIEKILSKEIRIEIGSLTNYLSKNEYALEKLSKYFNNFPEYKKLKDYEIRNKILEELNIKYIDKYTNNSSVIEIIDVSNIFIEAEKSDYIIFDEFWNENEKRFIISNKKEKQFLNVVLKDNILTFKIKDEKLSFDIKKHIKILIKKGIKELSPNTLDNFIIKSKFEKINMEVIFKITNINSKNNEDFSFHSVSGYLLLRKDR